MIVAFLGTDNVPIAVNTDHVMFVRQLDKQDDKAPDACAIICNIGQSSSDDINRATIFVIGAFTDVVKKLDLGMPGKGAKR